MLIRGDRLNRHQRYSVLAAFIYRTEAIGPGKRYATQEEWLRDHAFHFLADGSRMDHRYRRCEPAFLADDPAEEPWTVEEILAREG